MSRLKILLFVLLSVSSCSITKPYVDRKRSAGNAIENLYLGSSTPKNPAICYNALTTTLEKVKNLAVEECVKQKTGTTAVVVKNTSWTCTLLNPSHLYFECL